MGYVLCFIVGVVLGYQSGWVNAHRMVKHECIKTGSFFVGDNVFECKLKEKVRAE